MKTDRFAQVSDPMMEKMGVVMMIFDQGFMQYVLDLVAAADEVAELNAIGRAVSEHLMETMTIEDAKLVLRWHYWSQDAQNEAEERLLAVATGG